MSMTTPFKATMLAVSLLTPAALLGAEPFLESSTPHPRIVDGRSISRQFAADLKGALELALKEQGPVAAIAICRDEAPRIAAELSRKHEATVSRTSLKVRNIRNAPLPWQRAGLELFERNLDDGTSSDALEHFEFQADGSARYMKAIVAAPLCTVCHGESLSPEIRRALSEHYPEDLATGFKPGDLRGAFSIEWPAARGSSP
jgi:hypothetical protein